MAQKDYRRRGPGRPPLEEERVAPSGKVNPITVAQSFLRERMTEKDGAYRLDGVPSNLTQIMQATNAVLVARGIAQITYNEQWRV